MKINDLIKAEAEMPYSCKKYFGDNYLNTEALINLMQEFIEEIENWKGKDASLFMFMVQKHLIQALLSTTRLHQSQYSWNMRMVLEAGIQAAYCFENKIDFPEELIGIDYEKTNKAFLTKCYKWLELNYPSYNTTIKNLKEIINKGGTHAGFIEVQASIYQGKDAIENGIETLYFDTANDDRIRTDLWAIANITWGLLNLFIELNAKHKIFKIKRDTQEKLKELGLENEKIKNEVMNSEYYKTLQKTDSE